ncbi:MAG TPA: hypothetical protein VII35_12770 [Steroidobacteraceae bacterium]
MTSTGSCFDDDIRIHTMSLDDPTAVFIRRAELWHKYGAAVEQRPMVGDADRTAPGALADQQTDFPLPKCVREDFAVGGRRPRTREPPWPARAMG